MSDRRTRQANESDRLSNTGDAAAWLDDHGNALYRYARLRVGHREVAEDLVQDTMLAALQSRARFQGRATVRTWLFSILRHKVLDYFRRVPARIPADEPGQTARTGPARSRTFNARGLWKTAIAAWKAPDQALEDREFWDVLDGCLGRLPRSLSSAFILRELDEMEMAELQRILGLSEVNLRVRLHRARLLLRECLEKRWFVETPDGPRSTS